MKELFWDLFKKSGNIDAFMAYREYEKKDFDLQKSVGVKVGFDGELNG